jgi:hypothetical protein
VPCGGANHAPPEMVSSNATAAMLLCICYSIRKGHKQLADFSGGGNCGISVVGCWEKLLHHRRAKQIAPGGAVTFGLAK